MRIELDPKFAKKLQGRINKYNFEVGILKDGPHRDAVKGVRGQGGADVLSTYAGGPVRQKSRSSSNTLSQVSAANRTRLGFNYLAKPFENPGSEIIKFTAEFLKLAFGRSQKKRVENLLQAIVRNPWLRGEYGTQSATTTKIKGFYRPMIDTAQLFRATLARTKKVSSV